MADETPGRVASTLSEIRERARELTIDLPQEDHCGSVSCTGHDALLLLAAVEAALKLADEAIPALGTAPANCTDACDSGPCDCSGETRPVAWTLDPAKLREAIGAALTGEEAGDGHGDS